jgi:hypothetical protein
VTVNRGEETLEIRITRGQVQVPTVETEKLSEGIGYARIFQVSGSTPNEFGEKVAKLGMLDGLVLDLRSNSGGSMMSSAKLADFFLPEGTIVKTVGREGEAVRGLRRLAEASPAVMFRFPVVVLVDVQTASAAEILTGSLISLPHVTVIGQRTFGKGLVQRVYSLPDETLLKLTVAEYRLAQDRVIHLEGIEPDMELFPVSTKRLSPLANVPQDALPYLWEPGEDDRFPIEVGEAVLRNGLDAGLAEMRRKAEEKVGTRLGELGVPWSPDPPALPALLPEALRIDLTGPPLEAGRTARLELTVRNPNSFSIPEAWAALEGPIKDLGEKALPLGTIAAGGSASAEVEFETPDGLSAGELGLLVHVASRLRPLASQRKVLRAKEHIPSLEIEVVRKGEAAVDVTVRNRGETGAGEFRVDADGAFEVVEELAPGAEKTVELPLAGKVRNVAVTLLGPLADRRVEVPLPETKVTVVPPLVRLYRGGLLGFFERVKVEASAEDGLQDGWVALDNEKEGYVDWGGRSAGSLSVRLPHGEHAVRSKVETLSGLAVYDQRIFIKD